MNNIKKEKNNQEISQVEESFFAAGKKITKQVFPEKKLLTRILDKIDDSFVTNNQVIRNYKQVASDGRNSTENNLTNLINNMNKYIKILTGGALISALVLFVVFMTKTNDITGPTSVKTNKVSQVKVEVAGEILDVDSLVADLEAIDAAFTEPTVDDSDLSASLIGASTYEI